MSWNVNAKSGMSTRRTAQFLQALARMRADVVLLQEVAARGGLWARLEHGLQSIGLPFAAFTARRPPAEKCYGTAIASRFPVALDRGRWAPGAPWPHLLLRATVRLPRLGSVEVLGAHMPHGRGNGWRKVETFEALARYLEAASRVPRVLGGDFNEPRSLGDDGRLVSFGQRQVGAGWSREGMWTRLGETFHRARWDQAVVSVLDGPHLRHAWMDRHGRELVATHHTRTSERSFDHLLVSPHFEVLDAGYEHAWRRQGLSDHSGVWADLRLSR